MRFVGAQNELKRNGKSNSGATDAGYTSVFAVHHYTSETLNVT